MNGNQKSINKLSEFKEIYPQLIDYHNCGFCLKNNFTWNSPNRDEICNNCEIGKSPAKPCIDEESLYDTIMELDYEDDDYINKKYDLISDLIEIIKNIPDE